MEARAGVPSGSDGAGELRRLARATMADERSKQWGAV